MLTVNDGGADNRVSALLSWWKLAGCDTPVNDEPRSWLALSPTMATAAPVGISAETATEVPVIQVPAGSKLPAEQVETAAAENFDAITSLAELEALVRRDHPRAPFADGDAASGVMLVGAGPAADDFRTGKPFSGPAGHLLDAMLRAIGLDRSSCYIGLAAPRWNRPSPPPAEAYVADRALIRAQIRLAAPRLLLLLGAGVVESLTGDKTPIGRLRGNWLDVGGVPALATYNPGYLLRRPEDKRRVWADLLAFQQRLAS